jgi:uncharacterized membrane protein YdjX (TVP38/TMEM64 family)
MTPNAKAWVRWLGPATIIALMAIAYGLGLHKYLSLQSLAENRDLLQSLTHDYLFAAVLAFVLIYATAVALSIPGAVVLTITGGLLFGWLLGGLASVIGATLGATVVFQIARSSFGEALAKRAGPTLTKLKEGFSDDAFNYLLFLRLVPAFPFWIVNIAPALANVKLRTFASATFLGIIPATFAFAFVGQGLDSVIKAQSASHATCVVAKGPDNCPFDLALSDLITTELLLAFAALGVVALIPVALKKWKTKT